jgi:hypothetical protein
MIIRFCIYIFQDLVDALDVKNKKNAIRFHDFMYLGILKWDFFVTRHLCNTYFADKFD